MINELYMLYEGLQTVGEEVAIKHKEIQSPGKGTTFRVTLDDAGQVDGLFKLNSAQIDNTWSIGNGNKNMFPAIKLTMPFLPSLHKEYSRWRGANKKPEVEDYKAFLRLFIPTKKPDFSAMSCWPEYRDKVSQRKQQLAGLVGTQAACVVELYERYLQTENGLSILTQVAEQIYTAFESEGDKYVLKGYCDILFSEALDSKGNVKDSNRVTLLLDFMPESELDIYVTSRRWVPFISEAIFATEQSTKKKVAKCALTGLATELVEKTFPSEKLSVVGKTILFAKNAGTSGPTVIRYGKSGSEAFAIGEELTNKLAASVLRVTAPSFEDVTWSKISSANSTSPSLLLAFCPEYTDLPISRLITGKSEQIRSPKNFKQYTTVTKRTLENLEGKNVTPGARVEIAEFLVLDKANRKINYATTTSVDEVRRAAELWTEACANHPELRLQVKIENSKPLLRPWSLAPEAFIDLTKKLYVRQGQTTLTLPALGFAEVMTLFLQDNHHTKSLAKRTLVKIANQYEPLIEYCALAQKQAVLKGAAQVTIDLNKNKAALNAVTVMAVMLFKSGIKKDTYMKDFAYRLGQLCAAMDEIHLGYCYAMRKGQIPNGLIGNQTYSLALQNPKKAMDILAERLKPYQSWVYVQKVVYTKSTEPAIKKENEKHAPVNQAVWAYRWLKEQSKELFPQAQEFENGQLYEGFKAELMLGYLAGRQIENKTA